MNILIFGRYGKVARELTERLVRDDHRVEALSQRHCDLMNPFAAEKWIAGNDIVINATAFNGIEGCAACPLTAMLINSTAPTVMADACKRNKALFIHFSTDYVLAEDELGLFEETAPKPSSIYGLTKLRGEEGVTLCGDKYLIFRLSSIYGRSFVGGPLDPVNQVHSGKGSMDNPVKVLHQFCAPTSARLVADAIAHVIKTCGRDSWEDIRGLYHLATSEGVWKLQFSRTLLAMMKHPEAIVAEGTLAFPRPIYTQLKTHLFEDRFGYHFPSWKEDLSKTLELIERTGP